MTIVATFRCLVRWVVCRRCWSDMTGKLKKVFQPVFTKFNVKTLNVSWNYCCQKFQFCPFEFNYYFIFAQAAKRLYQSSTEFEHQSEILKILTINLQPLCLHIIFILFNELFIHFSSCELWTFTSRSYWIL